MPDEPNQPPDNNQPAESPEIESAEPEDLATQPASDKPPSKLHQHLQRFKDWYRTNLKIAVPATLLAIALLVVAVPLLRYNVIGLAIKKNYFVKVLDAETGSPVSGATVTLNKISAQTDGNGTAVMPHLKVGKYSGTITKKYYKDSNLSVIVPVLHQKSQPQFKVTATGRQVKISIINTINKKPVSQTNIKVADITAKTDTAGNAMIVLPPGVPEQDGTLSADGYNDSSVKIKVSDTAVAENKFTLTPAGKIYFLSKRTGTINVMKSNLDGSEQQVVLAGTAKEDDGDTVLLASRDWKFLVLKANRDGAAKLYYIDTSVDKLNTLDEGNADFTLVGWIDHYFVYKVNRHGFNNWQSGATSVKTFNADNGKLNAIASTNATGSDNASAQYQNIFDVKIIGGNVVYATTWTKYPGSLNVPGQTNTISFAKPDSNSQKAVKSVDARSDYFSNLFVRSPNELDFAQYSVDFSSSSYFKIDASGNVSQASDVTDQTLNSEALTYLASPSGNNTFWVDERDGKSSFLYGDANGYNAKEIAKLDVKYQNYGWYSDNYLLVSKDSDEIYVMPSSGVKSEADLIKITDYHKPAQNYYGYGGGYGGL